MIVDSIADMASTHLSIRLRGFLPQCPVHLKIEALNIAGSIKLKTARRLIHDLEAAGTLRPGSEVIESSSGNLGVALAFICTERKYPFTCVTDPNVSPATRRLMKALHARLVVVEERDPAGGFLQARLNVVRAMLAENSKLVWTNQYGAASNYLAHYDTTGPELLRDFPRPDWVFIGTGTTGTLTGCARYLREHAPSARVVAVDPLGSVTFGGASGVRFLPGIGTSKRPDLAAHAIMDDLVVIPEVDAVRMCRQTASERGLLVGPSTGSVLCAILCRAADIRANETVIALAPDLGDRYLDTVYDDEWVEARFPGCLASLDSPAAATAGRSS